MSGSYDLETIHSIVNESNVVHVSFNPTPEDPFPVILPMIGVMGSYEYPSSSIGEPQDCYLHGWVSARMMRTAKESEKGLPVCLAATKVDGLVLASSSFNHSYNYRSVMLQGYAKFVEDIDEKLYAMKIITNSVVPERYENTRPPDSAEITSTGILRVTIETGSGKIHTGDVNDDQKDLKRAEVTEKIWTGVIPVYEILGTPIPAATNKVESVPEHVENYVVATTEKNAKTAIDAAKHGEAEVSVRTNSSSVT